MAFPLHIVVALLKRLLFEAYSKPEVNADLAAAAIAKALEADEFAPRSRRPRLAAKSALEVLMTDVPGILRDVKELLRW